MAQPQQIGDLIARIPHNEVEQHQRGLPTQSSRASAGLSTISNNGRFQIVVANDGGQCLSLYKEGELTPECIVQNQLRLHAAFPRMGEDFFNLLTERLVEKGFSDEKLTDAINHLIDNFQYKELNIADVLRFDRVKKIYTYGEYCDEVGTGRAKGSDFETIEIEKKKYWIKTADKYR